MNGMIDKSAGAFKIFRGKILSSIATNCEVTKMKMFCIFCAALSLTLYAIFLPARAHADDALPGELLLTVAPMDGADKVDKVDREARKIYLSEIAETAGAYVVKIYAALSRSPEDPILVLIRSDTHTWAEMQRALSGDKRVLAASPNRVMRVVD